MTSAQDPTPPTPRDILRQRARLLARPRETQHAMSRPCAVVVFHLAQEYYAIDQAHVREVHPLKELTPLPCTPAFIRGLVNVRSQVLPVIDIQRFFDLPEAGITDLHMVVILQIGDVELGIVADNVSTVRTIDLDNCQRSLPTLTGTRARYTRAVTDDHVVVLDIEAIVNDPAILVDEEVEA